MANPTRSQAKLTTPDDTDCPAQQALRSIAGKWKPRILRAAMSAPVRFNALLRELPDSNRQALTNALREMEADGLLERTVVRQKPLHVEYVLTVQGRSIVDLLQGLEG